MAKIHDYSDECTLSSLELFQVLPTQTAIEKAIDVDYLPLTSLTEGAPVEFYIPASTEDYLDLHNSRLKVSFRILKGNGTVCGVDDVVAPINDIFNALWSHVELEVNDQPVYHSGNTHSYISMISHLIHDSEEKLHSEGPFRLMYKDTAGQMDSADPKKLNTGEYVHGFDKGENFDAVADPGNQGLHRRFLFTHNSHMVEVKGPLCIDLFNQEKYLPPGVRLKLRLHRQKNAFMLMAAGDYKIDIIHAQLTIRKLRPSPGVLIGHEQTLSKLTAEYHIDRKEVKVLSVAAGRRTVQEDNLVLGQLPKRVVIAMVDNDAFSGTIDKNPYNFQHYNLNYIQLYADNTPILAKPLQPDIAHGLYLDCYETLFHGYDKLDGAKSSIIKREDWSRGYSLFSFDLTPDYDDGDHLPLIKHGNLRLEMSFDTALASAMNILMYMEFDNLIEINGNRNVRNDFT